MDIGVFDDAGAVEELQLKATDSVAYINDALEEHPDVTKVDVSLKQNEAVINMNQLILIAELQRFLDQDSKYSGRYSIQN